MLTPLAAFVLDARVLHRENYHYDSAAALIPVDLAVGWGPMSDQAVLDHLKISQASRFYYYEYQKCRRRFRPGDHFPFDQPAPYPVHQGDRGSVRIASHGRACPSCRFARPSDRAGDRHLEQFADPHRHRERAPASWSGWRSRSGSPDESRFREAQAAGPVDTVARRISARIAICRRCRGAPSFRQRAVAVSSSSRFMVKPWNTSDFWCGMFLGRGGIVSQHQRA